MIPYSWQRVDGPEPPPVWCGDELRPLTGKYVVGRWTVSVRSDPKHNRRLALTAVQPERRWIIALDKLGASDVESFDPERAWAQR